MSQQDSFDAEVDFEPAKDSAAGDVSGMSDDDMGQEEALARRRRDLMFKAGVGVVVAAGLGFWLMRPSAPPPAPVAQEQISAPEPVVAAAQENAESVLMPESLPDAPEMAPEGLSPAMPQPVVEAPTPEVSGAPEGGDPLAWDNNPSTTPVPDQSAVVMAPENSAVESVPAESSQGQAPSMPMEESVVQTSQPQPTMEAPPAEPVASVENRLLEVENTLIHLQEQMVTRADLDALRAEIINMKPDGVRDTSPVKPKTKKKKTTQVKKPSAPQYGARETNPSWVLKSAKPGRAWVSRGSNGELKSIALGETLPGIGRILSIAPNAQGRWVVVGSENRISQ